MDLISDLVAVVPSLLDPTNPLHNVTLLTNTFIGAFLVAFLTNLAGQTVRHLLGKSDILRHLIHYSFIQIIASDKERRTESN